MVVVNEKENTWCADRPLMLIDRVLQLTHSATSNSFLRVRKYNYPSNLIMYIPRSNQ